MVVKHSTVVAALAVVGRPVAGTKHSTSSPVTFYCRDAGLVEYISRYYSSRHSSALVSETLFQLRISRMTSALFW